MEKISNQKLEIGVKEHGAELCSIIRKSDGREYMWQASPEYWKRHSPVLFPIVGSLWNKEMRQDGKTYTMGQHGFARDMDFELIEKSADTLRYRLTSSEETKRLYPYDFILEIGYKLADNKVTVEWKVKNPSEQEIHFQIGAHPAFNYMNYNPEAETIGYFKFDKEDDTYTLSLVGEKGCLKEERAQLATDKGILPINRHSFDNDAIILENDQVHSVTLLDADKKAYLTLRYEAPVIGLWSPARDGYAPFVCIEPWYGRCDRENYTGEYSQKDWMQHLAPGKEFDVKYSIEIL
ncbi:MAG: aldose 1-epimerase family protein [Bacteroidetes bacterium]|uniref:Aldose 1-epimerase family protein n=1 Tax=Candidatus Caccoplasma merdipullorum TaxID=2840718 RepID=A0A9D9E267_9BACT|nr:aldose 1-epimerase family protein [Candidatus Caccoplasma merdipullorum]